MQLVVRVVEPADDRNRLVAIDADDIHTVTDLYEQLGASSVVVRRTGRRLRGDRALVDADVRSGDELVVHRGGEPDAGTPPRRDAADRPPLDPATSKPSIVLGVVGGPETGRSFGLAAGRHSIGRSRLADITLADPSVSRHHLDLTVGTGGTCTAHVIGAPPNGVAVGGEVIPDDAVLTTGDVVVLGASSLAVRPAPRVPAGSAAPPTFDFRRTPYRPPIVRDVDADPVGPVPERAERRRFGVVTALVPLVAGGAMFLLTHQVVFLALTLLSPVVMIGTTIEDRRSGRRTWKHDCAAFRARLGDQVEHLARLRADERDVRVAAAPDLADLVDRAERLAVDLWARSVDAPDALALRLGLGRDRVRVPVVVAPGGAADLRAEAEAAVAHLRELDDVPVTVDLVAAPITALQGARPAVDRLAGALVAQLATLHSPHDVVIAAAVAPGRGLGWLEWLPHVRSVTSPIAGPHLVDEPAGADALLAELVGVGETRSGDARSGDARSGEQTDRRWRGRSEPWPRVVAVIDAALDPDPVRVARLADVRCGISVIWLADRPADVPRYADAVVEVRPDAIGRAVAHCWSTDPDVGSRDLVAEQLAPDVGERLGRALAPVRDASTSSGSGAIPRVVPLRDVVDADAGAMAAAWRAPPSYELQVPLGMTADGPLTVDLVADGPHTLIGGTSGAGKSELLQSMVAGLAAAHPPTRLTFLFVDYKGGSSTQAFGRLPHSVGHVTNLSDGLAERALVSLRAELRRRMALLEGRAKDLAELLHTDPSAAPPSLVIVVDEFATLVAEVPEFMAGIVDVAQRGRSLGIHLVLATQRPVGAVDDDVLSNTNLRLALRMLDRADSSAVLASPAAADIAVPLRGRGLVRLGPDRLVEFQSPWASAPVRDDGPTRRPLRIEPFGFGAHRRQMANVAADTPAGSTVGSPRRQVDEVVDAAVDAGAALGLPSPRRPWCDPLPDRIPLEDLLDDLLAAGRPASADHHGEHDRPPDLVPGRHVPIGRLDDPAQQRQGPAVLDLAAGAALLVAAPGAGASTFVRTVVTAVGAMAATPSARSEATPAPAVLVVDMSGRELADLAPLPHVVDVARGDDMESVTRHLLAIDHLLGVRRGDDVPGFRSRIVVCIDGLDVLADTLLDPRSNRDADRWLDIVGRLVTDGRQVGVSAVLTATRRSSLPARLHAAVAHRIVLRQHDPTAYADLGVPPQLAARLAGGTAGRCVLDGRTIVQLAIAADPGAVAGRAPAVGAWSAPLPDRITLGEVSQADGRDEPSIVVGVADVTGRPAVVDLRWDDLVVGGPARSGRTTALDTVAAQLGTGVVVIPSTRGRRPGSVRASIEGILADPRVRTVVVDDVDRLDGLGDPSLAGAIETLTRRDDIRLVGALDARSLSGYSASPLVTRLRRASQMLLLRPDEGPDTAHLVGRPVRLRPGLRRPPGRGLLVTDGDAVVVQVALAGAPAPSAACGSAASAHQVLFDNRC